MESQSSLLRSEHGSYKALCRCVSCGQEIIRISRKVLELLPHYWKHYCVPHVCDMSFFIGTNNTFSLMWNIISRIQGDTNLEYRGYQSLGRPLGALFVIWGSEIFDVRNINILIGIRAQDKMYILVGPSLNWNIKLAWFYNLNFTTFILA
jgi:hypothetical protein